MMSLRIFSLRMSLGAVLLALGAGVCPGSEWFVAGGESDNVVRFDFATDTSEEIYRFPKGSRPYGIASDLEGRLLVGLESGSAPIYRLERVGGGSWTATPFTVLSGRKEAGLYELRCSGELLYAAGGVSGDVLVFDVESGEVLERLVPDPPLQVRGLTRQGTFLYLTAPDERVVLRMDLAGEVPHTEQVVPATGHLTSPGGVTIGPRGHLYAVTRRGTRSALVQRFDLKSGASLGVFCHFGRWKLTAGWDIEYDDRTARFFVTSDDGLYQFDMDGNLMTGLTSAKLKGARSLTRGRSESVSPSAWGYSDDLDGVRALLDSFTVSQTGLEATLRALDQLEASEYDVRRRALSALISNPVLRRDLVEDAVQGASLDKRMMLQQILALNNQQHAEAKLRDCMRVVAAFAQEGLAGRILAALEGKAAREWETRLACRKALLASLGPEDGPVLVEALDSETPLVREVALVGLLELPGAAGGDAFASVLEDSSDEIRFMAAGELLKRKDPACLRAFARLLQSEIFAIRYQSHEALWKITGKDFGYFPGGIPETRREPAARWEAWIAKPDVRAAFDLDAYRIRPLDFSEDKPLTASDQP